MTGAVPEAGRSLWSLDKIRVLDAGRDGDGSTPDDNALFMTQGAFVP
jgi:hypothetical protein